MAVRDKPVYGFRVQASHGCSETSHESSIHITESGKYYNSGQLHPPPALPPSWLLLACPAHGWTRPGTAVCWVESAHPAARLRVAKHRGPWPTARLPQSPQPPSSR